MASATLIVSACKKQESEQYREWVEKMRSTPHEPRNDDRTTTITLYLSDYGNDREKVLIHIFINGAFEEHVIRIEPTHAVPRGAVVECRAREGLNLLNIWVGADGKEPEHSLEFQFDPDKGKHVVVGRMSGQKAVLRQHFEVPFFD